MISEIDIRKYLLDSAQRHPFLKTRPEADLSLAISTCLDFFGESILPELDGILNVKTAEKNTKSISVTAQALPALVFAHAYFGKQLPKELIQKLKNPTQITDTFFELQCLGEFAHKHTVVYEPKTGRKVPDFKIILPNGFEIYVECKSHGSQQTNYTQLFNKVCDDTFKLLDKSKFVSKAREQKLRTEILPIKTLHSTEIQQLLSLLDQAEPSEFLELKLVTKNVGVVCMPKERDYYEDASMTQGLISVNDKVAIKLDKENMHLALHSWKGLDLQRRKSQRSLLAEARRQLKEIPSNSLGLVCIEVYSLLQSKSTPSKSSPKRSAFH